MSFTSKKWSLNKALVPGAAASCLAIAMFLGIGDTTAHADKKVEKKSASVAPAAVFPANAASLGAIPDNSCAGAGRQVTFTVSGLSGAPTDVRVNFTGTHSWVGDLDVVLQAPGGSPAHDIFTYTGGDGENNGDNSDLGGPYNFYDTATGNWWAAAATAGATTAVAAGDYRTADGNGVNTLMTPAFSGLATANGTWTLKFNDCAGGDTGSVSAASLTIEAGSPPVSTDAMHDYDGDGKSDHVVVRNIGGGEAGQVRWFINPNAGGSPVSYDWGLASDFFVGGDFDGDGKDDIVVWRPATIANFYILNSADSTVRAESFGQNGDDPSVVGDYDGDGKADLAVYRAGDTGQPSNWFYRASNNNPSGNITFTGWGQGGDFPAPGDYDGDGKHDFVVQRGGTPTVFWRLYSNGTSDSVIFGNADDQIVPGDYDGDGKTDIAVAHSSGGNYQWWYYSSQNNVGIYAATFGLDTDSLVAGGDYDGDGRADYGVWRDGIFYYQSSATGTFMVAPWGTVGDYPVANYTVH